MENPAPLMTTIAELGSFLAREAEAAGPAGLPVAPAAFAPPAMGPVVLPGPGIPPPAANGSQRLADDLIGTPPGTSADGSP